MFALTLLLAPPFQIVLPGLVTRACGVCVMRVADVWVACATVMPGGRASRPFLPVPALRCHTREPGRCLSKN